jgi:hypothetical protein
MFMLTGFQRVQQTNVVGRMVKDANSMTSLLCLTRISPPVPPPLFFFGDNTTLIFLLPLLSHFLSAFNYFLLFVSQVFPEFSMLASLFTPH